MEKKRNKSENQVTDFGEEMATDSSILAWETPWTEEPGGLSPRGFKRVGHDLVTKLPSRPPPPYTV